MLHYARAHVGEPVIVLSTDDSRLSRYPAHFAKIVGILEKRRASLEFATVGPLDHLARDLC